MPNGLILQYEIKMIKDDMSSFNVTQPPLLEKEMATHSSTLAWKILWTKKPVGCSPWGCKESDTTEAT